MTPRQAMDNALKSVITQHLRPRGFTGSLPHLRRRSEAQVCLISVRYFSAGGSFAVEIAECGPAGFTTSSGRQIPPGKVTAQDIPTPRPRLGSADFPQGDHWFVFGPRNYEPGADKLRPFEEYDALATEVLQMIESQAEPFWSRQFAARTDRHPD
ncbi:DUF4304 domain-containing protein [Kribbella sp. NPDC051587]|uniref:DUF4304 domain-containing protein n=1 Tax=Kribbella sp. NPDC051587 TaxID=3364119 RepID=UPI003788DD59